MVGRKGVGKAAVTQKSEAVGSEEATAQHRTRDFRAVVICPWEGPARGGWGKIAGRGSTAADRENAKTVYRHERGVLEDWG